MYCNDNNYFNVRSEPSSLHDIDELLLYNAMITDSKFQIYLNALENCSCLSNGININTKKGYRNFQRFDIYIINKNPNSSNKRVTILLGMISKYKH